MIGYIYTLSCPKTKNVIYVGKTINSIQYRGQAHYASRSNGGTMVGLYIKKINAEPIVELVEEVSYRSKDKLEATEMYWIEQFRQWGFPLLNKAGNKVTKYRHHNGKEIIENHSRNIRISNKAWEAIRKHCFKEGIAMSRFVSDASLEKIKQSRKRKPSDQQLGA